MESIAYHLRQDGKYFPVTTHIYCSEDGSLSGEAEAAEFIIATRSKGVELAKQILDTWIGLKILAKYPSIPEDISVDKLILPAIQNAQSLMEYPLDNDTIASIHTECNNYTNIGELKDYLDIINIDILQVDMMTLLNQQFCRVRYGGIYDSHGDPELWFRISSVGVSWTNVIYEFVTTFKNKEPVECITICKDRDIPGGSAIFETIDEEVKVYKASDGELYLHMPIEEYLSEVHDTKNIFTSTSDADRPRGKIYQYIWEHLNNGEMLYNILDKLYFRGIHLDAKEIWDNLTQVELNNTVSTYI